METQEEREHKEDQDLQRRRIQCPACHREMEKDLLREHLSVCPHCGFHHAICPAERILQIADPDSFEEFSGEMVSGNPISIDGYEEKLQQSRRRSDLNEAVVTGRCTIDGYRTVMAIMSFQFMGGSMGSVVGEKITQVILQGADTGTPVVIFSASGGARMQEGIFSLMQMAKTSCAAALLEETAVPLFIVLTHPTSGGVTASFAMLGDVILAEPGAFIGFAGPRVVEGTIRQKLPPEFQKAEFQLKKGFVDAIVPREELRDTLSFLLRTHSRRMS